MVTLLTCVAFSAGAATQAEEPKESPLCSDTLRTAMDGLGMIPFLGDTLKIAATTARDASCPSSDAGIKSYMADQFAKVNVKLDNIKTQLSQLEEQLKSFEQHYNKKELGKQQAEVSKLDDQFGPWLDQYQFALAKGVGGDGKQHNSITDLVNSFKGGFDEAIKKNPELVDALANLYQTNSEAQAVVDLAAAGNFSTAGISDLCNNANVISGNVFDIRNTCNATSLMMYTRNMILEKQVEYAYNDVSKVYAMDKRPNKQVITIIPPKRFTDWVDNVQNMAPSKAIIGLIKPTENVYSLAKNLEAKGFKLTGWYTAPDKRYLTVEYPQATMKASVTKSKYAYQQPTRDGSTIDYANNKVDDKIVNVMGVPVPERFFTAGGADYRDNNAFPWAEHDNGVTSDPDNPIYKSNFFVDGSTPDFSVSAFGFSPDVNYNKNSMISHNNGFAEGQREIFTYYGSNGYRLSYPQSDFSKIGSSVFFTFMRFTYTDGFNYVFAVRTWLTEYMGGAVVMNAATQCMTNDCTIKRSVGTLGRFKFQNGPTEVYWGVAGTYSKWDLTIK